MRNVYRINGLPRRGLSGLTGTWRLKAALICLSRSLLTLRHFEICLAPPSQMSKYKCLPPKLISDLIFHLRKRAFVTFRGGETRTGAQVRHGDAPALHLCTWDVNCGRSRFSVVVYVRVHISGRPTPDKHTEATRLFPPTPPFFLSE